MYFYLAIYAYINNEDIMPCKIPMHCFNDMLVIDVSVSLQNMKANKKFASILSTILIDSCREMSIIVVSLLWIHIRREN